MKLKKYMNQEEVTDRIIELIENDLEFIKSVSNGDLSNLPSPEEFGYYLPMIIVNSTGANNEFADTVQTGGSILGSEYNYQMFYFVYHDNDEMMNVRKKLLKDTEIIANYLLNKTTLDDYKNENGIVLGTMVYNIDYENQVFELFRELNIPVGVSIIDYSVLFRTYR